MEPNLRLARNATQQGGEQGGTPDPKAPQTRASRAAVRRYSLRQRPQCASHTAPVRDGGGRTGKPRPPPGSARRSRLRRRRCRRETPRASGAVVTSAAAVAAQLGATIICGPVPQPASGAVAREGGGGTRRLSVAAWQRQGPKLLAQTPNLEASGPLEKASEQLSKATPSRMSLLFGLIFVGRSFVIPSQSFAQARQFSPIDLLKFLVLFKFLYP